MSDRPGSPGSTDEPQPGSRAPTPAEAEPDRDTAATKREEDAALALPECREDHGIFCPPLELELDVEEHGVKPTSDAPDDSPLTLALLDDSEESTHSKSETDADGRDAWELDRDVRRSSGPPPPGRIATCVFEAAIRRASQPPPLLEGSPPSHSDVIHLVDQAPAPKPEPEPSSEMADRFALGDFSGALRMAELILGREPENIQANDYAERSRKHLEQIYISRLGSRRSVPELAVPEADLQWLGLDPPATSLLARFDGLRTIEELLAHTEMSALEALKILVELFENGVIRLRD